MKQKVNHHPIRCICPSVSPTTRISLVNSVSKINVISNCTHTRSQDVNVSIKCNDISQHVLNGSCYELYHNTDDLTENVRDGVLRELHDLHHFFFFFFFFFFF